MSPSRPDSCEPHRPLTSGPGCWPEAAEGLILTEAFHLKAQRSTVGSHCWQAEPWLDLPFMSKWIFHVARSQTSSHTLRGGVQRELSGTGIFSHHPCDSDICQWQTGYAVCVCVCFKVETVEQNDLHCHPGLRRCHHRWPLAWPSLGFASSCLCPDSAPPYSAWS